MICLNPKFLNISQKTNKPKNKGTNVFKNGMKICLFFSVILFVVLFFYYFCLSAKLRKNFKLMIKEIKRDNSLLLTVSNEKRIAKPLSKEFTLSVCYIKNSSYICTFKNSLIEFL